MQVSGVVGVIDSAGLNHEIVTVVVVREELDGSLGHFQDGGFVGLLSFSQAVVVIAEVASGEESQHLAVAGVMKGNETLVIYMVSIE